MLIHYNNNTKTHIFTVKSSPMLNSKTILLFLFFLFLHAKCSCDDDDAEKVSFMVRKNERRSVVETEYGEISAVDLSDGTRTGRYHIQFFTLEPNSLFLPVLLHADMILYVKTGSGSLYWSPGDEDVMTVALQKGDVYRVPPGSVFFLKCDLQPEREKLRIHVIFTNEEDEHTRVTSIGAYSSIAEMIRGFDKKILQSAFMAPEEVIETIMSSKTEAIIHMPPTKAPKLVHLLNWEISFLRTFGGARPYNSAIENKKKKHKKKKEVQTFNVLNEDPDFKNCNGWSMTVTKKDLPSLKHSNIGVLYVNLTKGSMMGPHWNPKASEITVVVRGQGMIRVVCPSSGSKNECKYVRFRVEEGDVFVIPRFRPMAQMSFNNDSLVLVGFSTSAKTNHPQFLAGETSVLQVLDKEILAAAFKVSNTTITQLLAPQNESVILDCTSCAEYEELKMQEEIEEEEERREKEKQEEAERREEERERKEEEEKERREEEAKKREEEEMEREEEEEKERREEEAKKREHEEREREEEEEKERREEEAKEREEEERERREREEEDRKKEEEREREEEEAKKREEEEREEREREEEEEKEAKKREEKEEEEKEAKKREEKEEEEKEAKRREEEEEREREEEEEERREEERGKEHGETEEEAARRQEKERQQEQGGEEGQSEGKETKEQEKEGEAEPEPEPEEE